MSNISSSEKKLVMLCSAIYFVSYITRINYAAVMAEFIKCTGFSKESASFALTGIAVFYGAGQLFSGWLGDRVKPKILISSGLAASAAMNLLLPFTAESVFLLTSVWCIDGRAQAMMWPPIVKLVSSFLSAEKYKNAAVTVSCGAQAATVFIYLITPVCISFSGWKLIFFISSAAAIIMALIVAFKTPDIDMHHEKSSKTEQNLYNRSVNKSVVSFPYIMFFFILTATVLQGIMRDGVSNWLPTYIENIFEIDTSLAILSGVLPSVFAVICYKITLYISKKTFKNEMICAAAVFSAAFAASALLALFPSSGVALSVILSALITGCMHGVNVILTCMIPPYFSKTGHIAFISGLINSCTYIGSALSGYGFAVIAQRSGWNSTVVSWAVICAIAAAVCFINSKKWQSFTLNFISQK